MAKCPVLVPMRGPGGSAVSAVPGAGVGLMYKQAPLRNCNKDARMLARVEYSSLAQFWEGTNKFYDLFPLCPAHMAELRKPESWTGDRVKHRGAVSSVTWRTWEDMLPSEMEAEYRRDLVLQSMASFKQSIKRMMGQSNAARLSDDDWRQLMEEAVVERSVDAVMRS